MQRIQTATGAAPSSTGYTYDDNGNTRTRTVDGVVTDYAYDSRNVFVADNTDWSRVTNMIYSMRIADLSRAEKSR